MKLIVAVDDRLGLAFNGRRQSRDRVMRERAVELARADGAALWMGPSTAALFDELPACARVAGDFVAQAGPDEWIWVEDARLLPPADALRELALFRWNRRYPGDAFFPFDPARGGWELLCREEFAGSSHPRITLERYTPGGGAGGTAGDSPPEA